MQQQYQHETQFAKLQALQLSAELTTTRLKENNHRRLATEAELARERLETRVSLFFYRAVELP